MSSTPSPKDWLILQCQVCGSPMKVRAESVSGQRVACPSCRSPVAVQLPGAGQPEFRASMPQDSDRVSSERRSAAVEEHHNRDEEFTPTLGSPVNRPAPAQQSGYAAGDGAFLQNLKSTDDHQSGKRLKVKKRRKQGAPNHHELLADWDTSLQSLPEAELYSDPWTAVVPIPEEVIKEKTRDFIVAEQAEDGSTTKRVKRVRKRRLFSWAQLFFRRLSMGMRILTLTVVAAIAVFGVVKGVQFLREKVKQGSTFENVVAESRPLQVILARQDEDGAFEAVKEYLSGKGVEGKLPWVRLPNRVRPLMEKYYKRFPDKPLKPLKVNGRAKIRTPQGIFLVLLEVEVKDLEGPDQLPRLLHFAVQEIEESSEHRTYRVDWEVATQWQEMSFDEFKAARPTSNVPFRVKLQSSDYYNHSFSDQKKWLAVDIYYPVPGQLGQEIIFRGYMDRTSEVFRKLEPITESGQNPSVIVNLRYPLGSISPDQVVIDSLVLDSWFIAKDSPPEPKAAVQKP